MSCYVKIQTRITDLELLADCLKELGYRVERRPEGDRRAQQVLGVVGPGPDGRSIQFEVAADPGEPVRLLGDNQDLDRKLVNGFHRAYAERLVLREAKARGFTGIERREVNGEIVLTLRKWVA